VRLKARRENGIAESPWNPAWSCCGATISR